MSRPSLVFLLVALLTGVPLASQAISVTGLTGSTVAGSASGTSTSSNSTLGNSAASHTPTHFQVTGIISNVNGDAGTFQFNDIKMRLVSGAGIIGANGRALHSLADVKSGQTVQVTLAESKVGGATQGPRTAYSVRVIR